VYFDDSRDSPSSDPAWAAWVPGYEGLQSGLGVLSLNGALDGAEA